MALALGDFTNHTDNSLCCEIPSYAGMPCWLKRVPSLCARAGGSGCDQSSGHKPVMMARRMAAERAVRGGIRVHAAICLIFGGFAFY